MFFFSIKLEAGEFEGMKEFYELLPEMKHPRATPGPRKKKTGEIHEGFGGEPIAVSLPEYPPSHELLIYPRFPTDLGI